VAARVVMHDQAECRRGGHQHAAPCRPGTLRSPAAGPNSNLRVARGAPCGHTARAWGSVGGQAADHHTGGALGAHVAAGAISSGMRRPSRTTSCSTLFEAITARCRWVGQQQHQQPHAPAPGPVNRLSLEVVVLVAGLPARRRRGLGMAPAWISDIRRSVDEPLSDRPARPES